jgi:hypothetical protein
VWALTPVAQVVVTRRWRVRLADVRRSASLTTNSAQQLHAIDIAFGTSSSMTARTW